MENNNIAEAHTLKANDLKKYPKVGRTKDSHIYKRTYSLDIKLSPYEKDLLEKHVGISDFNSMSAFVRHQIFGGKEKIIDNYLDEKFKKNLLTEQMLYELKRIGKNINQCTIQIISVKNIDKSDSEILEKILKKFSDELSFIKKQLEEISND